MSLRLAATSDLAPPEGPALAYGVLLLPDQASWDGRRYTGPRAGDVDAAVLRGLPGAPQLVQHHNLVAIIATRPDHAREAAARLSVPWRAPGGPGPHRPAANDCRPAPAPLAEAHYRWPLDGPDHAASRAIACPGPDGLTVWSSCPDDRLRAELTALLDLPASRLRLLPMGTAAESDTAALDAAAVAALLSLHAQRPVRVDGADLWLPHAPAVALTARLERAADDAPGPLILRTDGAATPRPSLARLLAHDIAPAPLADAPPYRGGAATPLTEPAPLTSLSDARSALRAAQVFAQESLQDEAASARHADPVAWRLAQLDDPRGAALIRSVAERADWRGSQAPDEVTGPRRGRGFAYASVIDDSTEPPTRNWAAWVADVTVDPADGAVALTRVVVGHDTDTLHVPAVAAERVTTDIQDRAQRLLHAPAGFDLPAGATPPASADPDAHALVPPRIDLVAGSGALAKPRDLQWSEAAALPAAAAVANAVYAATGVRLREPPFNGPVARARLTAPAASDASRGARRATATWLGGIAAAACGLVAMAWPWKAAIAPVDAPDLSLYSSAAIERGRLVAAAGDCIVCHTAPGGQPNTGGLALDTPFGTIYTTNITPDRETGIGAWSYAAFERAMRQGVHRDGRQLYPAFPYTAFARLTEGDMQALYAYLMSQPPVAHVPPRTELAFPYNLRPLMAGWNALYHDAGVYKPDPTQTIQWNRGAYLVQGAGHCSACHTPRNALGAERSGAAYLSGGEAEGWEAPALNALSRAPVSWNEQSLYAYLRTGASAEHGVAAGPMAPVIHGLSALPDSDIRAISVYLASLQAPAAPAPAAALADPAQRIARLERESAADARVFPANGERLYQGACAACHETRDGPTLFGARPSLTLNTNLHSAKPDNLVQVILNGIAEPADHALGTMPGFRDSLDDAQVADLVAYLRARHAPGQPAWDNVAATSRRLRAAHGGVADQASNVTSTEAALRRAGP